MNRSPVQRAGQTLVNLKGESSPQRSDMLQLCIILCRCIYRKQLSSHGYLSAVRPRRQAWSVELMMCCECHVALVNMTQ